MSQPGSIPMSGAGAGPPAAVVVSATIGTGDAAAGGVRCCDRELGGGPRCHERSQIYLRRPGGLHHSACADWNSCLARSTRSWRRSWCMPTTGRMLRLKLALRATGSDLARAVRACHDHDRPEDHAWAPAHATDWHSSGYVDPWSCVAVRWWREPSPSSGRTRPG